MRHSGPFFFSPPPLPGPLWGVNTALEFIPSSFVKKICRLLVTLVTTQPMDSWFPKMQYHSNAKKHQWKSSGYLKNQESFRYNLSWFFYYYYSCTHVAVRISKPSHILAIVGSLNIYINYLLSPIFNAWGSAAGGALRTLSSAPAQVAARRGQRRGDGRAPSLRAARGLPALPSSRRQTATTARPGLGAHCPLVAPAQAAAPRRAPLGKTSCEASSSTSAARGSLPPAAIASAGTGNPAGRKGGSASAPPPARGSRRRGAARRWQEKGRAGWWEVPRGGPEPRPGGAVCERCREGRERFLSSAHGWRCGGCKKARLHLWGTEGERGASGPPHKTQPSKVCLSSLRN